MRKLPLVSLLLIALVCPAILARVPVQDGHNPEQLYLLKEGTEVQLKFAEDLSSKTAAEDDRVNFELAEDLKVGDVIVAKAGSKAVGSVTHVKKAGMLGK